MRLRTEPKPSEPGTKTFSEECHNAPKPYWAPLRVLWFCFQSLWIPGTTQNKPYRPYQWWWQSQLISSKSTFSHQRLCTSTSEVVRIGSINHLSSEWVMKANFFILRAVILLLRLQEKFDIFPLGVKGLIPGDLQKWTDFGSWIAFSHSLDVNVFLPCTYLGELVFSLAQTLPQWAVVLWAPVKEEIIQLL